MGRGACPGLYVYLMLSPPARKPCSPWITDTAAGMDWRKVWGSFQADDNLRGSAKSYSTSQMRKTLQYYIYINKGTWNYA